jgi:hypothetical protein
MMNKAGVRETKRRNDETITPGDSHDAAGALVRAERLLLFIMKTLAPYRQKEQQQACVVLTERIAAEQ